MPVLAVNDGVLEKTAPTYPKFKVPVLEKVISQPVVPQVTTPEQVSVPVEILITFLRAPVEVVALMVSEPQDTVPAPTLRVAAVIPDAGLGMVMAFVTDSVLEPLTVTVLFAFTAA